MYDEEISENESVKALHNEIEVTEKAFESDSDSDDDLLESFDELYDEMKVLSQKYLKLKKEFQDCQKQNEFLKSENDNLKSSVSNESELKQQNKGLTDKVEFLITALSRLTQGRENLEKVLGSQYLMLDKASIGYK